MRALRTALAAGVIALAGLAVAPVASAEVLPVHGYRYDHGHPGHLYPGHDPHRYEPAFRQGHHDFRHDHGRAQWPGFGQLGGQRYDRDHRDGHGQGPAFGRSRG